MQIEFGGKITELNVTEEKLEVLSENPNLPELDDLEGSIRKALSNPVSSKRISESAKKGDRVLIVVEDIARISPRRRDDPVSFG
jgi:nickel-dependent lactate racemase